MVVAMRDAGVLQRGSGKYRGYGIVTLEKIAVEWKKAGKSNLISINM
jgi:hypothetical protein